MEFLIGVSLGIILIPMNLFILKLAKKLNPELVLSVAYGSLFLNMVFTVLFTLIGSRYVDDNLLFVTGIFISIVLSLAVKIKFLIEND